MTVSEVFTKIIKHQIKGIMVHEQLIEYFLFLGDTDNAYRQKCHYKSESRKYIHTMMYYTQHYNKLINIGQLENPDIIPESWYRYERKDVDTSTRKNGIENGLETWKEWEEETKKLYESLYPELISLNEIASAYELTDMIMDVTKELCEINELLLKDK